jgi:hypothetical protein
MSFFSQNANSTECPILDFCVVLMDTFQNVMISIYWDCV